MNTGNKSFYTIFPPYAILVLMILLVKALTIKENECLEGFIVCHYLYLCVLIASYVTDLRDEDHDQLYDIFAAL